MAASDSIVRIHRVDLDPSPHFIICRQHYRDYYDYITICRLFLMHSIYRQSGISEVIGTLRYLIR